MESYKEKIIFYNDKLCEYYISLVSIGLTDKDRIEITTMLKEILAEKRFIQNKYLSLKKNLEEFKDKKDSFSIWAYENTKEEYKDIKIYVDQIIYIENSLYQLVKLLYNKVHIITPREFVLRNSILTHLVYVNNEFPIIKPSSMDSFLFLCQFHNEKTPSMNVNNSRNFLKCFGCGHTYDAIEYFMEVENLTEEDAISQLANIYYLNYPEKRKPISELITKYQNVLLSDDFINLLKTGYNRTKKKDNNIFVENGIIKFENDFETIRRVENKEYKDYIFEDKPKRYELNPNSWMIY